MGAGYVHRTQCLVAKPTDSAGHLHDDKPLFQWGRLAEDNSWGKPNTSKYECTRKTYVNEPSVVIIWRSNRESLSSQERELRRWALCWVDERTTREKTAHGAQVTCPSMKLLIVSSRWSASGLSWALKGPKHPKSDDNNDRRRRRRHEYREVQQ